MDLQTHFQQKYASTVLELETLNRQLNSHLNGVQKFCQEVGSLSHFELYLHVYYLGKTNRAGYCSVIHQQSINTAFRVCSKISSLADPAGGLVRAGCDVRHTATLR